MGPAPPSFAPEPTPTFRGIAASSMRAFFQGSAGTRIRAPRGRQMLSEAQWAQQTPHLCPESRYAYVNGFLRAEQAHLFTQLTDSDIPEGFAMRAIIALVYPPTTGTLQHPQPHPMMTAHQPGCQCPYCQYYHPNPPPPQDPQ
jgi:hypothetical protein